MESGFIAGLLGAVVMLLLWVNINLSKIHDILIEQKKRRIFKKEEK